MVALIVTLSVSMLDAAMVRTFPLPTRLAVPAMTEKVAVPPSASEGSAVRVRVAGSGLPTDGIRTASDDERSFSDLTLTDSRYSTRLRSACACRFISPLDPPRASVLVSS